MNGIDHHRLSNESFKVRFIRYFTCDRLKPEIRKKHDVAIIHAGTNDLTNNGKSLENYKRMSDLVRSKFSNWKLVISNVHNKKR